MKPALGLLLGAWRRERGVGLCGRPWHGGRVGAIDPEQTFAYKESGPH